MNINRREFLKSLAATGLLAQSTGAWSVTRDTGTTVTIKGNAFGTHWHFTAAKSAHLQDALSIIRQNVRLVDASMSPYRQDSEVSLFNERLTTYLDLSPIIEPVVSASLEVAGASGGAFDPTVGPLVNKSGFGPIQGSYTSRYTDLTLHNKTLRKKQAGSTIDLCGIAKGHALDLIAVSLVDHGYTNFMIEIGGEILAKGKHPGGRGWVIGLEMPGSIIKTLLPTDCFAVATSGIAQQSYLYNQQRQSHLINPLIETVQSDRLYSVSVFHPNGMMADAWSTALIVLGKNSAIECANQNKLDAVIVADNQHSDARKQYEFIATGRAKLPEENA